MSRQIRIDDIESVVEEFRKYLNSKNVDSDISFKYVIPTTEEVAELTFSDMAYAKMMALVQNFNTEVAWHGVSYKDDVGIYRIEDIVVYPQTVTGATVSMDETEYANWIMDNAADERFNYIRAQGHSHVNMGTSPSSEDIAHQNTILRQLGDDDYYIFIIANKKGDLNVVIYDIEDNIVYEKGDIIVVTPHDFLDDFIKESKEQVKAVTSTRSYSYGGSSAAKSVSTSYSDYGYYGASETGNFYNDDDIYKGYTHYKPKSKKK